MIRAPHRIVINPSNENHVCIAADLTHPDGVDRATLFEICDVTAYQGVSQSQYSFNAGGMFYYGHDSGHQKIALVFTGSNTRLRTFGLRMVQGGTVPSGYTFSATLQTTSGGVPTGTVVATAVNTIDPSKITKTGDGATTGGQWVYFNFPTQTLTGQYAIVIEPSAGFPISTSNYIAGYGYNNVFPGYRYNGTSWLTVSNPVYEIIGEYVTSIGQALDSTVSWTGQKIHDQETQIELIDSTTAAIVSRRARHLLELTQTVLIWATLSVECLVSALVVPNQHSPVLL